MGIWRMARFLLLALCALFVASHALPTSLSDTDIQHLTEELSQAKSELGDMTALEKKEENEMKQIGDEIQHLPSPETSASRDALRMQGEVSMAARDIQSISAEASKQEIKQQSHAFTSMHKVDAAIKQIKSSERKSLGEGEGEGETPVEHALNKLQQVSTTLHRGSKTMHTKERLDRMQSEAEQLQHESMNPMAAAGPMGPPGMMPPGAGPWLGESKDESAIGALQHSRAQNSAKPAPMTSGDESAIEALQHSKTTAPSTMGPPPSNVVDQETQQFNKLMKQEKAVSSAEKADESEIGSLMKKLG